MFEKFVDVFLNRRGWVAIVPTVVIVANFFGVPLTEDILTTTGDKVVVGIMSALSLLSLFRPKV